MADVTTTNLLELPLLPAYSSTVLVYGVLPTSGSTGTDYAVPAAMIANYAITVAEKYTDVQIAGVPGGIGSFQQAGTGAIVRTYQSKMRETVSPQDFGAVGNGIADDSAAIQLAVNSLPTSGGELYFPAGTYLFNNVVLTNPIRIRGAGGFNGGTVFTTNSTTAPFFTGTNVASILISGFYATTPVAKTTGSMFAFSNADRLSITDFFMENYYIGISIDGGSEIKIDSFQMYNGVSNSVVAGGGAILLGKTSYTGSIGIDNAYLKCATISAQPAFGIRALFVDVLNIGTNVTIIGHGNCFDIVPTTGQTASLITSTGATYDTASIGVNISPTGTGKVLRADFYGGWYGAHLVSGIVIDGTISVIDGVKFHNGQAENNASCGANVIGANAVNIRLGGLDIGGNSIGVRLVTNCDVRVEDCTIGTPGITPVNTTGIATDGTVTGIVTRNRFTNNTTPLGGTAGTLAIFNNTGFSNWQSYTPTVTAGAGTFTTVSATGRYKVEYQTCFFEITITITTNGTAATSMAATLPVLSASGNSFPGRAVLVSGKMIQSFVGAASNSLYIANYDGSYAGSTGEKIVLSGSYEVT